MKDVDWDALIAACADEPIHIPGAVQPHGALLVVAPDTGEVLQASASCLAHLRREPRELLGAPLDRVLDGDGAGRLLGGDDGSRARRVEASGRAFDAVLTHGEAGLLLELEPATPRPPDMLDAIVAAVADGVTALRTAATTAALAEATASAMRRLTGFDRVDVYRFHDDWHGEVIAEDRAPHMEAYLGLHFPASDVPAQARALYQRNWFRQIVDARAEPSPLTPQRSPVTGEPLDLSDAHLRAVSPVHLQYLRNMGVAASMSVSILDGDRLWGLVACHHGRPRRLTWEQRSAAASIGELLSQRIADLARAAAAEVGRRAQTIRERVVDRVAPSGGHDEVLRAQTSELRGMCPGATVVVRVGDRVSTDGPAPREDELRRLLDWLAARDEDELVTRELSALYPPAAAWADRAAGALAGRLGRDGDVLLFLRPEEAATVTWAGAPERRAETVDGRLRLAPRESFSAWVEERGGRSAPWAAWEVEAALGVAAVLRGIARNRDDAVRLVENRFRAAVETLEDALTLYAPLRDAAGEIEDFLVTFVNEAGFANDLVPRSETVGARLRELPAHLWDDGLFESYVHTLETGEPLATEVEVGPADDPDAVFDVRASRFEGGIAATWRDVTERRRAEQAVRLASRRAHAASAAKDDVLSRVSHELRTPLNAVLGFSELQMLDATSPKERREYAGTIHKAGRMLLSLVDEILDLRAAESGRITVDPTSFEVDDLLDECAGLLGPSAEKAGVRIEVRGSGGTTVVTDRARLRQVLLNLGSNAVKFNDRGGTVTFAVEGGGDVVHLSVTDDGPGIPPGRLDDIFEPFERLDARRRGVAGTGLGLALARRLAEELGGELTVRSQLGEGATFTVSLPAAGSASRKSEPPPGASTTSA